MKPFLLAGLFLYCSIARAQVFKTQNFEVHQLSKNVYAAIALPGGNAACNAGIVDMGDGVLVIDPFLTPAAAEDLKIFISTKLRKPVKWVVNSHAHNDHIRGNQVFASATIISTAINKQLIETTEPKEIAAEKQFVPGRVKYYAALPASKDKWQAEEDVIWKAYFGGIADSHATLVTTPPNLTFSDSLTLYGKGIEVKLISYGDGHSASDLFVYLPQERIVFTGDLLFVNFHPYVGESKLENWEAYLRKMKLIAADVFIPGHGPAGDKSSIDKELDYFTALRSSADILRGISGLKEQQINEQMPEQYRGLHLRNFYAMNIQHLLK
ncbi:MAG: Second ring cyclase [Sphingobacteriaceae bacterium]|jgi:glyoxylase-like metal-dependent hydrolase (beta-lactamase superfamily II)|nr:Second ring cyclase [Sphingobacteriaceae bacterium]